MTELREKYMNKKNVEEYLKLYQEVKGYARRLAGEQSRPEDLDYVARNVGLIRARVKKELINWDNTIKAIETKLDVLKMQFLAETKGQKENERRRLAQERLVETQEWQDLVIAKDVHGYVQGTVAYCDAVMEAVSQSNWTHKRIWDSAK